MTFYCLAGVRGGAATPEMPFRYGNQILQWLLRDFRHSLATHMPQRGPKGMGSSIEGGLTAGALIGYVAALILIAALASGRLTTIRLCAVVAGLLWLVQAAFVSGDGMAAVLSAALAGIAGAQFAGARRADRGARLNAEEQAFGAAMLPGLGKAQLRGLLDQGYWLSARPGDILTREGEPVPHLYYLAQGSATVHSAGRPVGQCGAESFVGEVTVLSGDPATGTVEVESPARLWCVPAARLRLYAGQHDEVRRTLETAFRHSLSAKLVAANRRVTVA